jgi:thiamine transport system substrate-binding protein
MQRLLIVLLLGMFLSACGGAASSPAASDAPSSVAQPADATTPPATEAAPAAEPAGEAATLTIMSHDSFNVSEELVRAFEAEHNVKLVFRKSGDTGSALNQAILSKSTPLADVFYGIDNTFMTRALDADIFESYDSPMLADIPADLQIDESKRLLPVDVGYISINYDKAFLANAGLTPPTSLRDLANPEWKGLLVVENPATSSPGLAFLMATIAEFGEEGDYTWKQFWSDLRANDVLVSEGWEEAYYTHFSGSSGKGPRPLVVSYSSSPAAEVYYSEQPLDDAPTGNLEAGNFRQIEFVGILKGTQQRALAEAFVDWMLSPAFQEDVPLQMFVYPASSKAALPEVFTEYSQAPANFASLDAAAINDNRETWIQEWTELVLR